MSKFNVFRPTLNDLEARSLMSASPFSLPTEDPTNHITYDLVASKGFTDAGNSTEIRYELENVLITSYQTGGHEGLTKVGTGTLVLAGDSTAAVGSSGMSAGKVSFSDLNVMISLERDEVGGSLAAATQPQAADHKGEIEIYSWSFGASNPSTAGHKGEIEIVSWSFGESNPSASGEITKVGTGTLELHGVQVDAAGTHVLYQDITIPASATGFYRPTGDGIDGIANAPDNGGTGKAILHVRKQGTEQHDY